MIEKKCVRCGSPFTALLENKKLCAKCSLPYKKVQQLDKIEAKIVKLFKPYLVKRERGQCQILIPLIELDVFVNKIAKIKK